jgi:hypothetical protein
MFSRRPSSGMIHLLECSGGVERRPHTAHSDYMPLSIMRTSDGWGLRKSAPGGGEDRMGAVWLQGCAGLEVE